MTKDEAKRTLCPGCRNDAYNRGLGGAEECWYLNTAKVVERIKVGTWQDPPYERRPQQTLSCYHFEGGQHVFIEVDDPRVAL